MSSEDDNGEAAGGATCNGFVYSIDPEGVGFEDELDDCVVNRYGEAYARYKARVIKKNRIASGTDSNDDNDASIDSKYAGSADSDPDNYYSD